jgi:RNA polymerase sigma factor (sigma-70 family)
MSVPHDSATPAATDTETIGLTPEVIRTLVDNYARFLAFLERRVGREVAEEILQDAFVRGIDRGGALRDDESAVAWFYRVLRNAVVDRHRRRDAERRAFELAAFEPESENVAPDDALLKVVCACVGALVETLKPEYADAVRQVDLEGASVGDYAARVGITPNNAGVRLHRAREALGKQLQKSCGTCATHGCLDCSCKPKAELR